ncbi:unnamed protein product [Eruca vesicaria subsp. sativa]|uniref:Uncharacterized protein n=1 Tax=Eruca vesicaria subsp. sativa TaxID=29727 RepID=A0ABC8LWC3_ERUVS|nr:unnamed protein product [Eruca vesicaria subsp. sativa]
MDSCIVLIIVHLRKLLNSCAWNTTCSSPKWYGVVLSKCSGKQRLLYSLLDAMQSVTSQAVVIGISSRTDADQLLEKRVRSRFSHRKILFLPPSKEEVDSKALSSNELGLLIGSSFQFIADSSFPSGYVSQFSEKIKSKTSDTRFKDMLSTLLNANSTVNSDLLMLDSALFPQSMESGLLSLELYLLVCMRRLEVKEQNSHNFIGVMKRFTAFEHLREREVICYTESRGQYQTGEYRPMKVLISAFELHQGMRSHACCPAILLKLLEH